MTLHEIERITPTRELITPTFQWDEYNQFRKYIPPCMLRYRLERWRTLYMDWLWTEYRYFIETYVDDPTEEVLSFHGFCRVCYLCLVFHLEREQALKKEIYGLTQ
jgi:hypothetical protein